MRPLIDADILRYEIGFSGEFKDGDGEVLISDFDRVAELLDEKIRYICEEVSATEALILYLTGDEKLAKQQGVEYKPNFRDAVAVTKPYKGTRKSSKPYHFRNITAYMLANYECHVSYGLEADDSMCIDQCSSNLQMDIQDELLDLKHHVKVHTIICSRDKDLRMCPGYHYSWECGKQGAMGPVFVPEAGTGWLKEKPDGKIIGYGDMFFYYQMLIGDAVDTIPGAPGVGSKRAYPLLKDMTSKREMYDAVKEIYAERKGDAWKIYMREQADLLWMVREIYEGELIMFSPPRKENDDQTSPERTEDNG